MKTLVKITVNGPYKGLSKENGTIIVPTIYKEIIELRDGELYACTYSPVAPNLIYHVTSNSFVKMIATDVKYVHLWNNFLIQQHPLQHSVHLITPDGFIDKTDELDAELYYVLSKETLVLVNGDGWIKIVRHKDGQLNTYPIVQALEYKILGQFIVAYPSKNKIAVYNCDGKVVAEYNTRGKQVGYCEHYDSVLIDLNSKREQMSVFIFPNEEIVELTYNDCPFDLVPFGVMKEQDGGRTYITYANGCVCEFEGVDEYYPAESFILFRSNGLWFLNSAYGMHQIDLDALSIEPKDIKLVHGEVLLVEREGHSMIVQLPSMSVLYKTSNRLTMFNNMFVETSESYIKLLTPDGQVVSVFDYSEPMPVC
jgi:hypothetical protein